MIIIECTKEDLKLAKQEIIALTNETPQKYKNYFLLDDLKKDLYERFTLVNKIYKQIDKVKNCKSFKFTFHSVSKSKAKKDIEYLKNKGAQIILSKPEKEYSYIKFKDNTFLTEKVYENKKEYLKRHPKHRPGFHPGACVPKFARELVNLSGLQKGQTMLDPFCGTGGFLIEALDMQIKATGYDISEFMLEKSKKNLEYYKLKAKLKNQNALAINKSFDAFVTELPFGKTTKLEKSVPKLFKEFLDNASKYTNTIVAGLPSGYRYNTTGWKITFEHSVYIHKSLSKRIMVLSNKK